MILPHLHFVQFVQVVLKLHAATMAYAMMVKLALGRVCATEDSKGRPAIHALLVTMAPTVQVHLRKWKLCVLTQYSLKNLQKN